MIKVPPGFERIDLVYASSGIPEIKTLRGLKDTNNNGLKVPPGFCHQRKINLEL